MDNYNNKNYPPEKDQTGEVMSWVIIFILMVAFWPIGLILLLRKLNILARTSNKNAGKKREQTTYSAHNATQQYKNTSQNTQYNAQQATANYWNTAREAENAAREATAHYKSTAKEIERAAREAGTAARQAISEVYAELKREFGQSSASQPKTAYYQSKYSQARPAQAAPTQAQQSQANTAQTQQSQAYSAQTQPTQAYSAQTQQAQAASPTPYAAQSTISSAYSQTHAGTPYASQPYSAQYTYQWETKSQSRAAKAKMKKERTALEKKTGKFVSVVLLLIAIALFILGANTIAQSARDIWVNGLNRWPDFFLGIFYFAGGLISFFSRNISARRLTRYKRYYVFVSGRDSVSITEIARAAGLSERVVRRDLQAMINSGYLDKNAYIDKDLNYLVLTTDAAEELRRGANTTVEETAGAENQGNQFMSIILELREMNSAILDYNISEKIDRIEELTAKIFRIVEENPEKLPQIRRFMNYYLPTTLKLLRSYATLEKQGIGGENIDSTKESIGRILDTLTQGFEQQLDLLFISDAIDIAADINVLENLMRQDGLTKEKQDDWQQDDGVQDTGLKDTGLQDTGLQDDPEEIAQQQPQDPAGAAFGSPYPPHEHGTQEEQTVDGLAIDGQAIDEKQEEKPILQTLESTF